MLRRKLRKQPGLAVTVGCHVAMVINVITTQIGKQGGVDVHTAETTLAQRMRGHLDGGPRSARIAKVSELTMQLHAVRRGQSVNIADLINARTQRADVGATLTEQLPALRKQPGHGGLAVRAGNTRHFNCSRRRGEPAIGDLANLVGKVRHDNGHHAGRRRPRLITVPHDGRQ